MFELKIKINFYYIIFCNIFIFLKLANGNIKSRFLFIFLIEILWINIMIDNFDSFLFLEVMTLLINHLRRKIIYFCSYLVSLLIKKGMCGCHDCIVFNFEGRSIFMSNGTISINEYADQFSKCIIRG